MKSDISTELQILFTNCFNCRIRGDKNLANGGHYCGIPFCVDCWEHVNIDNIKYNTDIFNTPFIQEIKRLSNFNNI